MSFSSSNMTRSAFPMFDMMLNMQRLGMKAMSVYQPLTTAFLDTATTAARSVASESTGTTHSANEEQVIAVGEEVLNVGTRMIPGKTTRVRRVVVENPVHQDVTLHTETVVMERRKPVQAAGGDVLTEVTIEMSDFNEVPVVSKSVHLVEEVLLRKVVTARTETIHDTVRRDTLEIEQPSNLPAVMNMPPKQEAKKRDDNTAAENQDKKSSVALSPVSNKPSDQKRS